MCALSLSVYIGCRVYTRTRAIELNRLAATNAILDRRTMDNHVQGDEMCTALCRVPCFHDAFCLRTVCCLCLQGLLWFIYQRVVLSLFFVYVCDGCGAALRD